MPLPLIPILFGLGAVAAGGFGIAKGAKAVSDNHEAEEKNYRAQEIIDDAQYELDQARNNAQQDLHNLGQQKIHLFDDTLQTFCQYFRQIKNIELERGDNLDELDYNLLNREEFLELEHNVTLVDAMVNGTSGGLAAGAVTAFGAYGAASVLGTATTGTAIGTLTGAAATNATMAFFGGGALAAGGLGIAGGAMVLGGLVAGPALAIMGLVMGSKASENLDNARANLSKARRAKAEIDVLVTACKGVGAAARQMYDFLVKFDLCINAHLQMLGELIEQEGTDFRKYSEETKNDLLLFFSVVKNCKMVLDVPLLDKDGKITEEYKILLETMEEAGLAE